MAIEAPALPKRLSTIKDELPKQRKRSRTGGSKDLYEGHSQDVMLAKTLIDPDHQCSVTTVKAYVTHVCAWFRYCRTLADPNYTLVNEEKLSGFLTWATQTPRLPCKTGQAGGGGSMSYQSARRYVEGGILALWRRYRGANEDNPLHALSYLNTKYAIREATASERPRIQAERHYTAMAIAHEQEDALVRALLNSESDPVGSIRAWAYYCLGAATWIPGPRRLHLRLDSLVMSLRSDARLVEHTTVPFLEFRVSPDPTAQTARFAEVSMARHVSPLVCPWFAVALLVFAQWQARPTAMAQASLCDLGAWLAQPLFLAPTGESLVFLPDDTRVRMVQDEIAPLMAQATAALKVSGDAHVIRRRDKLMAEGLGLSAPQMVRLEKWRVHHRRNGVTRQQTFFDLTLVLGGQNPPPQSDGPHTFRAAPRTRLQVPDHLLAQVFPWVGDNTTAAHTPARPAGSFVSRQRSHSMAAGHSEDVARAERIASLRLMRELATVLLQDTAALLADPQCAPLIEAHPIFQAPLFASRAFREFCSYATQALSLQHVDAYAPLSAPSALQHAESFAPPPMQSALSLPHHLPALSPPVLPLLQDSQSSLPSSAVLSQRAAMSSDTLMTLQRADPPPQLARMRFSTPRARRHTFEPISEEIPSTLAPSHLQHSTPTPFNPMLLPHSMSFPPPPPPPDSMSHLPSVHPQQPQVAFPQLNEERNPDQEPMSPQYLMQIIDYLAVYNQQQASQMQPPQMHQQHHGQQLFPMSAPPAQLLANMPHPSDAPSAAAIAAAVNIACSNPSSNIGAVAAQFPRLASESSESTASPELASGVSHHMHLGPLPHQHQNPLLLPQHLSTGSVAHTVQPLVMHAQPGSQLMYFNAPQDLIDPSTLVGTATPPTHMSLPKPSTHQNSLSPSSTSPTPTPSSSSPGLHPSVAHNNSNNQLALPPNAALHFAMAPQKLQFKADHELFM
ncbi:hypothetical protein H4R24_000060 [Coemansia sp. RSA 988]|nr:hypothetical protein H4R24_000060 [Coemansia sp. RSA 988]